ncbi:hypothetical protein BDZ89DRAFT_981045 [Hymenopellis radicata]|nr:hypothetical protein BDZ89DRAFT_981045 [Hymenopellis radicata]
MSFATNASAFGLKPATTSTTSAFGQPSGQTNAFGASTTAPATNAFSAFGQNNQQQQNKSIFGQPSTNTPSLFGQPQQQQSTAAPSLFGQSNQQQQQQPTTSLFGQQNQPQQQQQQQQQPSTFGGGSSIFGQSNQNQQQQPAATGTTSLFGQQPSLFGQSTNQNQQQQQQPSTGLFGQSGGTGTGTSLFGNSTFGQNQNQQQNQQQQQSGSLFGNSSLQSQPTIPAFGNSLFSKPQQQQQSTASVPQNTGAPLFTKSTKFNDLPDALKRQFEEIESHIQGRIQISKDLSQRKLGEEPVKSQEQLRSFHKELIDTVSFIRSDVHHTKDLKAKTEQAVEDTITAMRIIDAHKSQQMNHPHLKDHASFPFEFFNRLSKQMRERLVWCKTTIEQIERKLASMAQQTQYTPHGITATLQAQHSIFLALASKTAVLDAELQKIKGLYTQLWRTKTGSVRDPFNELDTDRNVGNGSGKNGDLGLSRLSVR